MPNKHKHDTCNRCLSVITHDLRSFKRRAKELESYVDFVSLNELDDRSDINQLFHTISTVIKEEDD
jgi:hypothetical protein